MVDTQTGLEKLLGKDMPEIAYLRSTNISQVLSKGLAETFRVKPSDPKTYFAKFLLNFAKDRDVSQRVSIIQCVEMAFDRRCFDFTITPTPIAVTDLTNFECLDVFS